MHHRNLEAVGEETLRLLTYTDNLLTEHIDTPDLVREADPEQARQLDKARAVEWQRVLHNEIEKVRNLEAVIAVVGAAKAGKSTTINAIVGADILPNRSDPMTTFPTLVRHTPGQIEPRLIFPLASEFQELAKQVKARLFDLQVEKPLADSFPDQPTRVAAQGILAGSFDKVEELYEGREDISAFLGQLNDFCRLSTSGPIHLELPDPEKDSVARLPVIEIEFHHVVPNMSAVGRLTILDSPGPNEAGQGERLRRIVQEQLRNASAVILVCDCTHNRTDAEEELQQLVKRFLAELHDRLFVFVNKIDQLTYKDHPETVKEDYARVILAGELPPERIFPIAARNAFLANWGLRELKNRGSLPDPTDNGITGDFGKQALGTLWLRKISNTEDVHLSALELWNLSRFDEALQHVVQKAADNAAIICLKGATAKVLLYSRRLESFLGVRQSVATHDVESIREHIKELELDIEAIRSTREVVDKEMKGLIEEFNVSMDGLCEVATKDVEDILNSYFEKGRVEEVEVLRERGQIHRDTVTASIRKKALKLGDLMGSLIDRLSVWHDTAKQSEGVGLHEVGPLQGERAFRGQNHKGEADAFVSRINDEVRGIFARATKAVKRLVGDASSVLAKRVVEQVNARMDNILAKAKERLERAFDATFEPPKVELKRSGSLNVDMRLGTVAAATEYNTRYVERAGGVARWKRWFGDLFGTTWGYDEITEAAEISKVNLSALRDRCIRQLGGFERSVEEDVRRFIESDLQPAIDAHFQNLTKYVEEFRGDLFDALEDTKLEAGRLDALQKRIAELRSEVENLLIDAQSLEQGLGAV